MLPIQILLSIVLFLFFFYAVSQKKNSLFVSYAMICVVVIATFFLWFPESTNWMAHHLGVSRGADLLLYGFILFGLIVSFNLHLRQRRQDEKITKIVRQLAIEKATQSQTR